VTPGKFLRLVWPATGHYCIAHPFRIPSGNTVYSHKVFSTISEAVTHVHEQQHQSDTYFAVLSLREERVWDPEKTDARTGEKGAWAVRKQGNMLASRCSFFDLDVGPDKAKYPTQRDALADLLRFIHAARLPMPTLVSSGGGVHVYWHYDADVPVDRWRTIALNMRQLAEALRLKVDPTRTTDITSVLRVPDTFNWKDKANPLPVKVLQEGAVTPVAEFVRLVSDALIRAGIDPQQAAIPSPAAAPLPNPFGESNMEFNDFGPPPTLDDVAATCAQVREMVRAQADPKHPFYGQLDNTAWYRGMLATLKHVENGADWCRKLTALHPRTNADVDAKLLQLEQFGPARCETLQQYMPWKDAPCQGCRFRDQVPNPLVATRKGTSAPPPTVNSAPSSPSDGPTSTSPPPPSSSQLIAPSMAFQTALIPNPPKPYERLKAGGIAINRKDKDGNDITVVIYGHDLFPLKRLVNSEEGVEQQIWRVTLPRTGAKDFMIDADVLYDSRKFCSAIANNGIYPNKADIPALQDYMVAYISKLQRDIDADSQCNHLGWTDEYHRFVLPDKTLLDDGTVRVSTLTAGAQRAAQHIHKKGDLAQQVALMAFFDNPVYVAHQSVILDSLASVIFYATGHHGIVVNMSGAAGASKTTSLYTAAGLWGDPALWPINGTNRGATANARSQRVVTNANLPTCVDEITHLPPREAIDLVMNVTQPGHRLRLQTDGSERKAADDNYKSAIMLTTANSSLHALLSVDNAAGTAGSMRVFEMKFVAQRVHTKAQADEYLRQIKLHYGHIGEVFAQFVIKNRVAVEHRVQQLVREIDQEAEITSGERFWSARVATGVVAGEIAAALGLMPYNVAAIRQWAIQQQIPFMRGVVKEEYRDSLAVLTDYIAEKHGSILIVQRATAVGANTAGQSVAGDSAYSLNTPSGALLGHYDVQAGVLHLLKQGFRDHCNRTGASSTLIVEELHEPRAQGTEPPRRIVTCRSTRRTLGAGTNLAKGQSWCFSVDMTHPEISGAVPLNVVEGGVAISPPAGNLKSVAND
jgi:hypothetical protein